MPTMHTSRRWFRQVLVFALAALAAPAALGQSVTVTNLGCKGTRLAFPSVATATSYTAVLEEQSNCTTQCAQNCWATLRSMPLAVSSQSPMVVPRTPYFTGRWRIDARNKAGAIVGSGSFSASGVIHLGTGAPLVNSTPSVITACAGTSFELKAHDIFVCCSTYQWHRNGIPIAGATQAQYTGIMTAGDPESSIFHCVVTNGCGSSSSAPVEVRKGSAPPSALFNPTECAESDSLSEGIFPCGCLVDRPTVRRSGFCNSLYATVGASTLDVNIAAPATPNFSRSFRANSVSFLIEVPTRFQCTAIGIDAIPGNGTFVVSPSFRMTLYQGQAGATRFDVSWNGSAAGVARSQDIVLGPGVYRLAFQANNGAGCCGGCPTPCGPFNYTACSAEASAVSLSAAAQFTRRHPADLNGDWSVNGADLALLLGAWGGPGGDVNGNGITNGDDLAILLSALS